MVIYHSVARTTAHNIARLQKENVHNHTVVLKNYFELLLAATERELHLSRLSIHKYNHFYEIRHTNQMCQPNFFYFFIFAVHSWYCKAIKDSSNLD